MEDMVHRPYYSDVVVNNYTKGVDVNSSRCISYWRILSVNKVKEATVYIDEIDVKQNKYDAANKYIDRMTYALKKKRHRWCFLTRSIERWIHYGWWRYGWGTAGNPVTVSVANVFKLFTLTEG